MPTYHTEASRIDFGRKMMILDTNVLVKAFHSGEPNHEDAQYFLNEYPYHWLIPAAVVVETWGWLVGSRKDWQGGFRFLAWLNTPGKAVVIVPQQGDFNRERDIIENLHLDCVDAIIGNLAHDITLQCALESSVPIATYDTSDFFRLRVQRNLRMNVYDMNSDLLQDLD